MLGKCRLLRGEVFVSSGFSKPAMSILSWLFDDIVAYDPYASLVCTRVGLEMKLKGIEYWILDDAYTGFDRGNGLVDDSM